MALEIEDGTGKEDTESYATVEQFRAKSLSLGVTIPKAEKDCEILLRKAMGPMRRGDQYIGTRFSRDQALDFPRVGVVIESFSYDATELPTQLAEAQMLFAFAAQTTDLLPTLSPSATGAVIEKTVDVITTRFADPGVVRDAPRVQAAERVLKPLLRAGGGIAVVRA